MSVPTINDHHGRPITGPSYPDGFADIAVISLLPHPVTVYPPETPDRIDPDCWRPVTHIHPGLSPGDCLAPTEPPVAARLDPEYSPAPLLSVGDTGIDGPGEIPLRQVRYAGTITGLPDPDPAGHIRYLVSLVVAIAAADRSDLVVVDREVRTLAGTVCGCRGLSLVR